MSLKRIEINEVISTNTGLRSYLSRMSEASIAIRFYIEDSSFPLESINLIASSNIFMPLFAYAIEECDL